MQWFIDLINPHYFTQLHFILIIGHVVSALVALVTGVGAMATRKGGFAHRRIGRVYFWSMFAANGSAMILLGYRFNLFLLGVTVISFYGALAGYRVIFRKRARPGLGDTWIDRATALGALVVGLALIFNSLLGLTGAAAIGIPPEATGPTVSVILPLVFGVMIAASGWTDLRQFRRPVTDRRWWLYYHMNTMLGSYIGLTTALMVQQVGPRLPQEIAWIVWILLGVIGSVAISRWIGSYRRRFAAQTRPLPAGD